MVYLRQITLRVAVALITFILGVVVSAVFVIYHFSSAKGPEEPQRQQPSPPGPTVSDIPTVPFCNLLANPADYNQKLIRTEADLFSNYADLTLSDPSSCVLPHPMVGIELDPSFHYDPSDESQRTVYELLRPQGERKYGRSRVVIVGRFEGPIFPEGPMRDKRTGKYEFRQKYKYQHRFTIRRLEKAEPVSPEEGQPASQ